MVTALQVLERKETAQANCTPAQYQDFFPGEVWPRFPHPAHGVCPYGQRFAQCHQVQVDAGIGSIQIFLVLEKELSRRAIDGDAELFDLPAQVLVPETKVTTPAVDGAVTRHLVTWCDLPDTGSNRFDRARPLVTEVERVVTWSIVGSPKQAHVGSTQPDRVGPDQDLAPCGDRHVLRDDLCLAITFQDDTHRQHWSASRNDLLPASRRDLVRLHG